MVEWIARNEWIARSIVVVLAIVMFRTRARAGNGFRRRPRWRARFGQASAAAVCERAGDRS